MEETKKNLLMQNERMNEVSKEARGRFTTIGGGHGAPCEPATRKEWEAVRQQESLKQMCRRIREGEDRLKHYLPVWTPHCAEFRNNHRSIADALKPLPRLMLDFDEKGHTKEILSRLGVGRGSNPGTLSALKGIEVLLVEESVREGTHVLVGLPQGMTVEEAQELMAELTGFEPDKAVKDVARCIYMVPMDHTRYVSERLFEVEEESNQSALSNPSNQSNPSNPTTPSTPIDDSLSFKGIPYSSIVREWWLKNGGEPEEGERNVKLHRLAVNLRAICDNKKEVLMAVMPRFGLSETELKSIVDSACKEEPKGISKGMQGIVDELAGRGKLEDLEELDNLDNLENLEKPGKPEKLSVNVKALPIGLRESLIGVPKTMEMPVLCAVLPIAGAYADQVEVEYCDGNRQRLGLMSIIHGAQA